MRSGPVLAVAFAVTLLGEPTAAADLESRIDALLAKMTLEEKVGQLTLVAPGLGFDPEAVRQGHVGAVMNLHDAVSIRHVRELARQSRLKIPVLMALDVVHGFRTLFPIPLAEAATFDPSLARLASKWAAREAVTEGIDWTFGPMADVARDVRWGRIVEGAGEDVHLATSLTVARVEGFRAGGLATATKHFVGYGASAGGRDYDAVSLARAELRDHYLPPFRAAVQAGTETIMGAFVALDGEPVVASHYLLTGVLRREWGFDGFVVSDYAGVAELLAHGVAADPSEAVRIALSAGLDMEMTGGLYQKHVPAEVRSGRLSETVVDEAVRRVLRVKLRLGLFEKPDPNPQAEAQAVLTPEVRQVARQIARESLVLLQNRDGTLPISPKAAKLALVGPFATSARDQLGPHEAVGRVNEAVTILDAVADRARSVGVQVVHASGCDVACESVEEFGAAVEAARAADLVIAVLGESRDLTGEGATRAYLGLPGRQRELLDALFAVGKPVVLVLLAGRPLELGTTVEKAASILMAWYPGTEGGPAIAEILFGDESPSGKLPHTWPRTVGQLPLFYNRLPSGRPTKAGNRFTLKYIDEEIAPLFPFGWGLGYTSFTYSDIQVVTPKVKASDSVEVQVTLTNTGLRPGKEVAQLYVRDLVASRSRPVRELKGFQKVALAPGEARRLTFTVPAHSLGFHNGAGTYIVEPGRFAIWVGGSSCADLEGSFEIIDTAAQHPR